MSGFKSNMWKYKIPLKSSGTLPSKNKFFAKAAEEDEPSETKEDNTASGSNTEKQKSNDGNKTDADKGPAKNKPTTAAGDGNQEATKKKSKKCYLCNMWGHISHDCPTLAAKNKKDDNTEKADGKLDQNTQKETENTESIAEDADKPKRKRLNLSVICYLCRERGHLANACPTSKPVKPVKPTEIVKLSEDKSDSSSNKNVKCYICNTMGHSAEVCSFFPVFKQPEVEEPTVEKPVLKSTTELIKANKCTYCGVQGHFIQACPVKKWRTGPAASESETEQSEAPKPVPVVKPKGPTIREINMMINKKKKLNTEWKTAHPNTEHAPLLSFHPNAAIQMPGQPIMPVVVQNQPQPKSQPPPIRTKHMGRMGPSYPAGIPRSFLNQKHQEQLGMEGTAPQPNQQPSVNWAQPQPFTDQQPSVNWAQPQPFTDQQPSVNWAQPQLGIQQTFAPTPDQRSPTNLPAQTEEIEYNDLPQAYSPSDVYGNMNESGSTEVHEGSESPDPQGQKRLSAFKRLGPVTQKKPKLTINLMCDKGEAVREVVDETEEIVEEHTPVHLRNDVTTSTDETVMKYLYFWPWKKTVPIRRTVGFKTSKSAMLLEQEQMEECYDKDNTFMQITVTNYPKTWSKEEVFDVLLEQINVIPCFIEFSSKECKFLVIRSKPALMAIHKMAFKLRKEDVEMNLTISVTNLTQNQIDFIPRLVLRKRLVMGYDGEDKLDLQEFTLKSDISHFIYFPLKRLLHQTDLIQLQSVIEWEHLTELNLSRNRLTSIDGFHLINTTPRLKVLDLSYNNLDKVTALVRNRNLPLRSVSLEGNPLCHHYTDPAQYVTVVRMLFPAVREIDGVKFTLKGDLPAFQKNYSIHGAQNIVEKYLETFFPLLEAQPADRQMIDDMYDENALMTVLYRYKFIHRLFRISSINSHFVDDGVKDVIEGAPSITKYISKWPSFKHDPFTFTVDVLFHSDTATVIKICGILKLTAESLAEDEHIITFSRTTLLRTTDGVEYKILNELLLWDEPSNECHDAAFQITKVRSRKLYVDLEFAPNPDEESKQKLIAIFGHLTELGKHASRRCLERKEWDLRSALNNFIQLLKLNDLSSILAK